MSRLPPAGFGTAHDHVLSFRATRVIVGAAILPVLGVLAALVVEVDSSQWFSITGRLWLTLATEGLVANAAILVVAAPLLGVSLAARRRAEAARGDSGAARRGRWRLVLVYVCATASMLTVSLAVTAAAGRAIAGSLAPLLSAHAPLGSAAVALGAFGAMCGTVWADELDAALVALVASVTSAFAFVLLGPLLREASTGVIDALLLASPVVASASAAGLDLVRTAPFYQWTAVAHRQFSYPEWYAASGCYAAVTIGCIGAIVAHSWGRTRSRMLMSWKESK